MPRALSHQPKTGCHPRKTICELSSRFGWDVDRWHCVRDEFEYEGEADVVENAAGSAETLQLSERYVAPAFAPYFYRQEFDVVLPNCLGRTRL